MIINGWSNLNFNSPFADLAIALNINWLVIVLYLDAFVSPSGTGTTYMANHITHAVRNGEEWIFP